METAVSGGLEVKLVEAQNAEIARLTKIIEELTAANLSAQEAPELVIPGANASRASSKERWAIIVDEGNDATELSFVPVGVNGRVYQITRGRVVEVPLEVLGVLDHAILDKAITTVDSATGMPNGSVTRKVRRFPYQKLGKAIDSDGKRVQTFEDLNSNEV